jgi:hypothetical protein
MEFSTERLKPLAEKMVMIVKEELGKQEDVTGRAIENEIRKQLHELGKQTFSMVLSQADDVPEREIPCQCGGTLYYQRRRPAQVLSVFDRVEYKRNYYADCECGKGKAPLDEKLGLRPNQPTSGLASLLGMAGIEMAFDYSSSWLTPYLMFEVSENTIRKETQQFGELQRNQEDEWIKKSQNLAHLQERLRTEKNIPKRVYGSVDGAKVRIEERSDDEKEDEKWREMKVGCWYQVDPVPESQQTKRHRKKEVIGHQALRARDMSYFCDIAEVDDFAPLFWATACQVKADLAPEIVFVCDGAKWIWRLIEQNFPHAFQILDWYHAEERLEKVANDVFSKDQGTVWLDEVRSEMWEGNTQFVISACDKLSLKSEIATKAVTYFRNNSHRMHYDHYRKLGYMIGSGTVESGCKQIVTHRLKRSGAQWNVEGAILTAKARAAFLSGDWENLCLRRDQLPLAA